MSEVTRGPDDALKEPGHQEPDQQERHQQADQPELHRQKADQQEPDQALDPLLGDEGRQQFHAEISAKEKRIRRARVEGDRTLKWGYGAFGTVGWSIAVPALLGTVIGLALDRRLNGGVRYTLSLLVAGLVVGMINVWKWMNAE